MMFMEDLQCCGYYNVGKPEDLKTDFITIAEAINSGDENKIGSGQIEYTVTVTNGSSDAGSYRYRLAVSITADAAPSGKRFKNWTTSNPDVVFANEKSTSTFFNMPANNVEVTAVYEDIPVVTLSYNVTYNGNGSSGGTVPKDAKSPYIKGSTVTVLGNTGGLTKTGFTFAGWNTKADGTGTDYAENSTFTINADTTLYAKWDSSGSGGPGGGTVVDVTGVTLNKDTAELTVGYKDTLTATVSPANATNKNVTWSSNNPNVAEVDQNGAISANNPGYAIITVKTQDGSYTDTCVVIVAEASMTYAVTVVNGTSDHSSCAQGEIVNVTADAAPEGQRFKNWTTSSPGVVLASANSESTSFAMPANAVTITANYVPLVETTDVTFTAVQVGGTSGTANSTGIRITFDKPVTGLTVNDITVTNGTGKVVQGSLSGSGTTYTIALSAVTEQGTVTVGIGNFEAFNVTTAPRTVDVYKNSAASPPVSVVYGDLDGSGSVDNSDLINMQKLFSQPNLAVDMNAADVNGDGFVNNADLILLSSYFSQYGIVLGPQ